MISRNKTTDFKSVESSLLNRREDFLEAIANMKLSISSAPMSTLKTIIFLSEFAKHDKKQNVEKGCIFS